VQRCFIAAHAFSLSDPVCAHCAALAVSSAGIEELQMLLVQFPA